PPSPFTSNDGRPPAPQGQGWDSKSPAAHLCWEVVEKPERLQSRKMPRSPLPSSNDPNSPSERRRSRFKSKPRKSWLLNSSRERTPSPSRSQRSNTPSAVKPSSHSFSLI